MDNQGNQKSHKAYAQYFEELIEDEDGYLDPLKRASTQLISQLPSRHIDTIFPEESPTDSTNLRRRDSKHRTLQLKNATLNSHRLSVNAEKIYEILTCDPNVGDEEKLQTLKEMHQSLTIKRQVKEKLDADRKKKIATHTLSISTRFKLAFFMGWQKFCHGLEKFSYAIEPWHLSIKTIQGQFGSGVASYFIFLRWLLYINMWNFFTTFCFVLVPQLVSESHGNHTSSFHVFDLLTGSGWFTDSMLYFGHYSHKVIKVIPNLPYNMPLAYVITIGINALLNLFAVSSSITSSYRKNYVDTVGEIKNVFANKIFSAWDYAIETESAAQLQKRAFCNEMKELLERKLQDQEKRTLKENVIQKSLLVLVTLFCLAIISAVGYVTYYMLARKALRVDIRILEDMSLSLTVTLVSSVSYFVLKFATNFELYISKRWKIYLTMIRVVSLRIVMLGIIAYFWMVIYKPPREMQVCYETELGKEIYRLILVNFLVASLVFTLIGEYGRKLISNHYPSIKPCEFDVAYHTLDLIYYQTLAWIAIFCVPLGSLMIIIILVLLFYIKKISMFANCRPPMRALSVNEAQTVYLILTFIMFFFSAFTVGYSIFGTEPSDCGPFRGYEKTGDIVRNAIIGEYTTNITHILKFLTSPGVLFSLFCALGLGVYYMRAKAKAHISVIKKIREQLILASKDKAFLLKLFDDAFSAQIKEQNSPLGKNTPNDDQTGDRYDDESPYYSYPPVEPKIEFIQSNVPSHKATPTSPGYKKANSNFASGFKSPLSYTRRGSDSPVIKRSPNRGSESPVLKRSHQYPGHQHGFRHWPSDNNTSPPP